MQQRKPTYTNALWRADSCVLPSASPTTFSQQMFQPRTPNKPIHSCTRFFTCPFQVFGNAQWTVTATSFVLNRSECLPCLLHRGVLRPWQPFRPGRHHQTMSDTAHSPRIDRIDRGGVYESFLLLSFPALNVSSSGWSLPLLSPRGVGPAV